MSNPAEEVLAAVGEYIAESLELLTKAGKLAQSVMEGNEFVATPKGSIQAAQLALDLATLGMKYEEKFARMNELLNGDEL